MLLLLTLINDTRTKERDGNWFLDQITPRMYQALTNEAYRILHNKDDVDDVLQEAMIIGITKCGQLRDEAKLFQWMFKIVRREAYARQSKASVVNLFARIKDIFETPPIQPDTYLISKEEKVFLYKAMDKLDEESRHIVLLKTSTGMSLKEIANQLCLNYNTVRSKYQRALDSIKLRMEAEYNEEIN